MYLAFNEDIMNLGFVEIVYLQVYILILLSCLVRENSEKVYNDA